MTWDDFIEAVAEKHDISLGEEHRMYQLFKEGFSPDAAMAVIEEERKADENPDRLLRALAWLVRSIRSQMPGLQDAALMQETMRAGFTASQLAWAFEPAKQIAKQGY